MKNPEKLTNLEDLKKWYLDQYEGWMVASEGCSGKNEQEKRQHMEHIRSVANGFKQKAASITPPTPDALRALLDFHWVERTATLQGTVYGYSPLSDLHFSAMMIVAKEITTWKKSASTAELTKT